MDSFSNIKDKLLVEQVEEQIFHYIVSKPVAVGEKLPNEFRLGEQFGVGRSTVREAVKLLVSKGVLEIRRGAGTYVLSTATAKEDPLGLKDVKDKVALALDLADLRIILEPSIAEMAAVRATKEEIQRLKEVSLIIEEKIAAGEPYIQEDVLFHTYVAECSHNQVIRQLIPIIDTTVMLFVNVTHNKLAKETVMTHRAILSAIEEGDYLGARTAMSMHMAHNRDMIKQLLKQQLVKLKK